MGHSINCTFILSCRYNKTKFDSKFDPTPYGREPYINGASNAVEDLGPGRFGRRHRLGLDFAV